MSAAGPRSKHTPSWRSFAALAGPLCLAALSARAQSSSEGAAAAASVAPGYVDLAAHMREVEAAERAERCQRAREQQAKKGKRARPLPSECADSAAAHASPAPPDAPAELALPVAPLVRAPDAAPAPSQPSAPTPAPPSAPVPAPPSPDDAELVAHRRVISPATAQPAMGESSTSREPPPLPDAVSASPQPAPSALDEGPDDRGRSLRGGNELLVGGGVVSNSLTFGGDVSPESVAIAFTWRALSDQEGSLHNTLLLHFGGEPCEGDSPCSLRATGLAGFSPDSRSTFSAIGSGAAGTDELDWSSLYFGGGLKGRFASGLGLELGAQVQSLSMSYILGAGDAAQPHDASLGQLRLSTAASFARGNFELRLYLADTLYFSGAPGQSSTAPLRGVFYDPEVSGLASGPQGFFGKLEAGYAFQSGFSLQVSYGHLGYAGPEWSAAQLVAARLGQELGRFQLGLELAGQLDSLSAPPANQPATQSSVYLTGSVATRFN